ncbi:MAG TPA: RNA polymerase sigma-70 factor [Chitinophagaceae bacterium]|nr:RNA polymerase sigma-70 factor [Chitinophagaceae bacterium]
MAGRIANDDAAAYKELFLLYQPRLLQFACSITRQRESAEEVVSDVFLHIWQKRKELSSIRNLHLYLYIAVKNGAITRLEQAHRHRSFSLDDVDTELTSIGSNPEQLLLTAEMLRRIRTAVAGLPPRCRLIFKLVKEDGLRYREVAELLHLSVKTVESQMAIALRRLHQSIQFDPVSSFSKS